MFEILYGQMIRQMGFRSEAADPAGSLHAKSKDIKDYLANTVNPNISKAPWAVGKAGQATLTVGSYYKTLATNTTEYALTINGPRLILGGHIRITALGNGQSYEYGLYYDLIVDGNVLLSLNKGGLYVNWDYGGGYSHTGMINEGWAVPFYVNNYTGQTSQIINNTVPVILLPIIPFNSSFQLRARNTRTDYIKTLDWQWSIWSIPL
jgi:hypothetical protein